MCRYTKWSRVILLCRVHSAVQDVVQEKHVLFVRGAQAHQVNVERAIASCSCRWTAVDPERRWRMRRTKAHPKDSKCGRADRLLVCDAFHRRPRSSRRRKTKGWARETGRREQLRRAFLAVTITNTHGRTRAESPATVACPAGRDEQRWGNDRRAGGHRQARPETIASVAAMTNAPIQAAGCCWLLLAAAGCCWLGTGCWASGRRSPSVGSLCRRNGCTAGVRGA